MREQIPVPTRDPIPLRIYLRANWRGDLAALAFLLLATLLFFWPVVLGQAWLPRGGGDSVSFLFPMYRFAAQSFQAGTIPLWNPYQYAGAPFITDNQAGIFYPPNLLLFLLNPQFSYKAIQWLVIGHVFFAGAAMFACIRLLQPRSPLPRPAALVAALAFMFSGVFIAHIGNLNLIAVAAWLPLVFLALHQAIIAGKHANGFAYALLGGVFLGLATLAGHGQMTFLLAFYLGLYALYRALSDRAWWPLAALLILGVTAVALAAINLLPSLAAVPYTVRAAFDADRATNYALPWRALAGLFAPGFYGRGEVLFWGDWARVEYGYAGVLTIFLAVLAPVVDRSRLTVFFVLSALLALVLALGSNAPLFPLLVRLVPAFPFQVPARFVLLLDFSLAGLAAIAVARLMESVRPLRGYLLVTALLAAAVLAWLFWRYRQLLPGVPEKQDQMLLAMAAFAILAAASWLLIWARSRAALNASAFGLLAVLLLAADLLALGWFIEIEPNDPSAGFAAGSPALAYVKENAGLQRVEIVTGAWQPNLAQMEGLYSIDGVYNPLELANYAVYIGSVGYRGSPLYNLLGTKYLVAGKKEPPADTAIIVPVFDQDPNVTVYLNTLALPRALVVHQATVVDDHDAAFGAVHDASFDPTRSVVLENGQSLAQEPGISSIEVLRYEPNQLAFQVSTDRPAYFVLSDMFHPQWQATVDGQAAPILVANYAMRAVPLEAGDHLIEMRFVPAAWNLGLWVTLISVVLLVGAGLLHLVRRSTA